MNAASALRLNLLFALGCVPTKESGIACLSLDEAGGTCPDAADVDPSDLTPADCGAEILSVDGGPTEGECWYGPGADTAGHPGCFYDVTIRTPEDCDYGRPFSAQAEAVGRADWRRSIRPRLDEDTRATRAAAWTAIGLAEHASVASFARVLLQLLSHGAPAALVRDTQRALADEVRHAELAFGLASAYSGEDIGPGPLPAAVASEVTLRELAVACVREGCLAETRSVLQLAARADRESDPVVATVLRKLATDEQRHAALAWRTVQWAVRVGGPDVRRAVAEALAEGRADEAWTQVIQPVAVAAGLLAA